MQVVFLRTRHYEAALLAPVDVAATPTGFMRGLVRRPHQIAIHNLAVEKDSFFPILDAL
jgi:hypothetical protein